MWRRGESPREEWGQQESRSHRKDGWRWTEKLLSDSAPSPAQAEEIRVSISLSLSRVLALSHFLVAAILPCLTCCDISVVLLLCCELGGRFLSSRSRSFSQPQSE